MCRFLLYKGKTPILLADLLTRPAHSIINQSFDSRLRLDTHRPINGDGFGVGWYEPGAESNPCIFTSTLPAWNNMNLIRLSEKIRSALVFAHVRAASVGLSVSESNCHPWQYGNLMWMHNGFISEFSKIKRKLQQHLRDELFDNIQGNTDSEHTFALFLSKLANPKQPHFTIEELKTAMLETIETLNTWSKEAGIKEPSLMNFAVTDGQTVVCTRYVNAQNVDAASLYYSSGTRFESYQPGRYRMVKADRREDLVVVASEPLTFERADWIPVPRNTMLIITPRLNVLNFPIVNVNDLDSTKAEPKDEKSGIEEVFEQNIGSLLAANYPRSVPCVRC